MRTLSKFRFVRDKKDLPTEGLYIILTQSESGFLGKAIQGFMRLWQWRRGDKDTDLIPNHADGLKDGYAIGALALGVDGNDIKSHFSGNAKFYIIEPVFKDKEADRFWDFMLEQQKESYKYLDILKYAWMTVTKKWLGKGKALDRKKWTCYSLVASAYNYAIEKDYFKDPYKITPYEVCVLMDQDYNKRFK